MADDHKMSREEAGRKGGQSQGRENNPGNFANDREKAVAAAGRRGGQSRRGDEEEE